ncbi:hypothetical protein CTAYLR_007271 [Chrysophaeum taylorii]|uniref:Stress-associated endoplasmic reticulum protein n=1 Tax=Chrysophaeum taylorii TaxID=2483200 RepID=A0AAD7UKK1_9STRA|nr:hypothetical protein CTAYLR_007271 [Chrysophaeum taylorii]
MPAPRAQRLRSDKYASNINKRGNVSTGKAEKRSTARAVGPFVVGFFLFVVVGSAILQILQTAAMGSRT